MDHNSAMVALSLNIQQYCCLNQFFWKLKNFESKIDRIREPLPPVGPKGVDNLFGFLFVNWNQN